MYETYLRSKNVTLICNQKQKTYLRKLLRMGRYGRTKVPSIGFEGFE